MLNKLASLLGLGIAFSAAGEELTNKFGFTGPEIFPIENQISQIKSADIDGDGLNDLAVVNNARSKITLLFNQTGKTNDPTLLDEIARREINELPPDARFRIQSIASEKRISSMVMADLNSDKRPDIAYYGEPKEVIVQYNEGTNKWSALKRIPITDGTLDPYALVHGDLNGDDRTDLLLLAESHIYLMTQKEDGTLAEGERIPYIGAVKSIQVLDIQGDGRDDLLLVNWDNPNPFRFRLQNASGRLGPEMHFTLPPIRSYWADDLDHDGKTEIVTIAQKSGRAQISNFKQKPAEELSGSWKEGQFQMMPLAKTSRTRRGSLWADLNGDSRSDLLVAEPDSGQLALSLQGEDGSFEAPKTFATLAGITDLIATDWNEDGKMEVFVLSADERQVGVTTLDENGRLGFPEIILAEGRPLVIAAGKIKGDEPVLAMITDQDGKRELILRPAEGDPFRQKLSDSFKANPTSLIIHDVDQDGRADLIALVPYEKVKIFLQVEDGDFKEVDVAPPGGNTDQPWVSTADVDGDGKEELLLPQRNFLRAVVLKSIEGSQWIFDVKEQINGAASNSRLAAATAMKQEGKKIPALFLFDAERKTLTLSERDDSGVWEVTRNIALPFTDFQELKPITRGDESSAVSLIGLNAIAWLQLDGKVWEFTELDGYETPIRDGFLHDVVSGDLNGDERKDLVFLETGKSYLDLVTFEKPNDLVPANRWQVFEERTFRSRRNELPEPREALITEVTGDGKNDLVVVVHDRVLLYPQE